MGIDLARLEMFKALLRQFSRPTGIGKPAGSPRQGEIRYPGVRGIGSGIRQGLGNGLCEGRIAEKK